MAHSADCIDIIVGNSMKKNQFQLENLGKTSNAFQGAPHPINVNETITYFYSLKHCLGFKLLKQHCCLCSCFIVCTTFLDKGNTRIPSREMQSVTYSAGWRLSYLSDCEIVTHSEIANSKIISFNCCTPYMKVLESRAADSDGLVHHKRA